jgi:hypothetical protein
MDFLHPATDSIFRVKVLFMGVPREGGLEYLLCRSEMATKREPGAPGWGLGARLMTLLCKLLIQNSKK